MSEKQMKNASLDIMNKVDELGERLGRELRTGGRIQIPASLGYLDINDAEKASQDAETVILKILKDLTGNPEPPTTYDDPEQTPLKNGYEAQMLREKWACGMDMPHSMHRPMGLGYFSDWFMAAFLGNHDDFMEIIKEMSKAEVARLLKRREGYMQYNAIFLPILGARVLWCEQFAAVPDQQFQAGIRLQHNRCFRKNMKMLKKLVELGADVNVHDLTGYTPLHHCLTGSGNRYTMEMAEFLLDNGAKVNAVNRFGAPPLTECVMAQNLDFIKLLIRYNADPFLKDNDGCSPNSIGSRFSGIHALLKKGEKRIVKNEREAAKVEKMFKVCQNCAKSAEKRCTGCFLVWFCSSECLKANWTVHKPTCIKIRSEYKEVEILKDKKFTVTSKEKRTVYVSDTTVNRAKASQFVVKVQVNYQQKQDGHLMVYNESRDVQYIIPPSCNIGAVLKKTILDQDSKGTFKGYFYSVIREDKHFIHPQILPPEKW